MHFIRHLPSLSKEEIAEMESLNPKSPKDLKQEEAERRFLEGDEPAKTLAKRPAYQR